MCEWRWSPGLCHSGVTAHATLSYALALCFLDGQGGTSNSLSRIIPVIGGSSCSFTWLCVTAGVCSPFFPWSWAKKTGAKEECQYELLLNQSNTVSREEQKRLSGSLLSHCSHLFCLFWTALKSSGALTSHKLSDKGNISLHRTGHFGRRIWAIWGAEEFKWTAETLRKFSKILKLCLGRDIGLCTCLYTGYLSSKILGDNFGKSDAMRKGLFRYDHKYLWWSQKKVILTMGIQGTALGKPHWGG